MAKARPQRKKSASQYRYNEILAIILAALAILMLLCLVTYHPSDWSFNTSSSQPVKNWIGVVGSVFADILFQAVGLVSYVLPFLLFLFAWRSFRAKSLFVKPLRIFGFVLFVFSGAGLFTIFGFYNGIIGVFVEQMTSSVLGIIGAGVLLSALVLASGLLITDFSFASFFESVGIAWRNFQTRRGEWFSTYKGWQSENEERKHAKIATNLEERIKNRRQDTPTISAGMTPANPQPNAGGSIAERVANLVAKLGQPPEASNEPRTSVPEQPPKTIKELKDLSNKDLPIENLPKDPANLNKDDLIPIKAINDGKHTNRQIGKQKNPVGKAINGGRAESATLDVYHLPTIDFLTTPSARFEHDEAELKDTARDLVEAADEFNVKGEVKNINLGPVVTTFEFKPDAGVKYSRVTGLADDLCLALKAESIRIERIPGKAVVGMEIPNRKRETIFLRDVIDSSEFRESKSLLSIALGKVIDGHRYVADLAKMPHLLIAGATGAGKSVGVNSLIVSILYRARPDEVKFIMVDPKRLELGVYADIPHLAAPIITDPKRAAISLKWAVSEMERRYKDLAGWGVRNIDGYNKQAKRKNALKDFDEEGNPHRVLPYIVIIIDELADLMMVSGKEVEGSITRLAQMARAVGIHLVLATQRPSVDVITGLIKANFPARISFRVSSKVDSRTIIDANGAEKLLGKGDMLFLPPGTSHLIRVHGAFVDESEIQKIVNHIKQYGGPEYDETITKSDEEMDDFGDLPGRRDKLFGDALKTVIAAKRASTSLLQRHLRIGYGRAAAILDALVAEGYIGEMDGSKRARPVRQKAYEALQEMEEGREF